MVLIRQIILFLIIFLGILAAKPGIQSDARFTWKEGEQLVYEVHWEFVYIGTITMSNLGPETINGKKSYHIEVVIESNPFLFWLDQQ